jgi:hypothetical protein
MPAPSIMEGVGERPRKNMRRAREAAPKNDLDSHAAIEPPLPLSLPTPPRAPPLVPPASCSAELARINNYAAHVIEGVAKSADEDLKLFTPDGQPTENLAKVMINMAAVEIGPARPRAFLVATAATQLRRASDEAPAPSP